jgi:hypothetical protein
MARTVALRLPACGRNPNMPKPVAIPFTQIRIGRFLFLLLFLLLIFFLRPFLLGVPGFVFLMDLAFLAVLIAGVYSARNKPGWYRALAFFAVLAVGTLWAHELLNLAVLRTVGLVCGALFMGLLVAMLVALLFAQQEVTFDLITGSICGYLLVGQVWAFLYALLETFSPGALGIATRAGEDVFSYSYFSYVTLTTLGYGDISPVSPTAQSLATLEAIFGQFYVAIIVARLVAIHVSQSIERR